MKTLFLYFLRMSLDMRFGLNSCIQGHPRKVENNSLTIDTEFEGIWGFIPEDGLFKKCANLFDQPCNVKTLLIIARPQPQVEAGWVTVDSLYTHFTINICCTGSYDGKFNGSFWSCFVSKHKPLLSSVYLVDEIAISMRRVRIKMEIIKAILPLSMICGGLSWKRISLKLLDSRK